MSNISGVTPKKLGGSTSRGSSIRTTSRTPVKSSGSKTPTSVKSKKSEMEGVLVSTKDGSVIGTASIESVATITPELETATPSEKAATSAVETVTPGAKTPSAKTATPSAKTATPSAKSATPSAKTTTPSAKSATGVKTATPSAKTTIPSAKTTTPSAKTATPSAKTVTPIAARSADVSSKSSDSDISTPPPPSLAVKAPSLSDDDSDEEAVAPTTPKTVDTGSRRSILKTPKTSTSQISGGRSSQQSDLHDELDVAVNGDIPTTSMLSLNDERKTVSINADPEVFYVERSEQQQSQHSDYVLEVENEEVGLGQGSSHGSSPSQHSSHHSESHHSESHHSESHHSESHHSESHHSGSHHSLVIENPGADVASDSSAVRAESHHSSSPIKVESAKNGASKEPSVRSPSKKSESVHSQKAESVHSHASQGSGSIHGSNRHSGSVATGSIGISEDLFITPMIQPLSQTDSVLATKDIVDPFKSFARKIAAQFTDDDITAIHFLANIPERVQAQLTTGVAVMNYLTNNRRMNVEFLTILLEEMERVDLLEELLAWVQERDDIAREGQKRGMRVGIAGPSEDESTFITVAQRMRERIMDPGTLVRGAEELVNLMGSVRAQVAECSIAILLAALRHHIMSEPVQEAGCVSLANICYHHRTLHALIVMQGGIRHVQLAMRTHVSNDLVQRAACGALANLALRYDDIRKQCVSDGVLKNIMNAMTAHKEEAEVQEQGCCALCNMATNQPDIQQKIADMGGLECVVTALKVHKTNEMVVGNALTALQILCSFNKPVQEQALKLHAMDYAINSMLAFPKSDVVMESATGVLGNMCSQSSKNRTKAGKNGAIKMTIDAIHSMKKNEDVVTRALIMLTNVCFNNDLNRIIAKKLGAVEAITLGMKTHPDSPKVQRQACRAISNICIKNVDLKEEILLHKVIDQVVEALQLHVNESRVVEPVLSALYSLCVYHGLRQEIDETRIEHLITRIREHYPEDSIIHAKAALAEAELKSDENCFGFIGNWRRMSHALWGGGDVVVGDERLDKTPGTTIPQQAKSALSAKISSVRSRASNKTTPMKVKEASEENRSPYQEERDLEMGEIPFTPPSKTTPRLSTPGQPTAAPSHPPSALDSHHASRAEMAEEVLAAKSRSSHKSSVKVKSRKSVQLPKEEDDKRSNQSLSPSQKFSPNRGLTEAEIF